MKLKADLHIHTYYSNKTQYLRWGKIGRYMPDSIISVEQVLQSAKEANLDLISITDHDEILGSLEAVKIAPDYGLTAIPGIEITSKDGHILAYGIDKIITPNQSAQKTIELVRKMGGIAVPAHAFHPQGLFFRNKNLSLQKQHPFDAFEVYSAFCGKSEKAIDFADKYNLPKTVGTDSKWTTSIGKSHMIIESASYDLNGILRAIKNGKTKPVFNNNYSPIKHGLSYWYHTYTGFFQRYHTYRDIFNE